MSRSPNTKCIECSKLKKGGAVNNPCYKRACAKKLCYYKRHDYYKSYQRNKHRYIKYCGSRCVICKSTNSLEVHHIVNQSEGGEDKENNTLTLCRKCHSIVTRYTRAAKSRQDIGRIEIVDSRGI